MSKIYKINELKIENYKFKIITLLKQSFLKSYPNSIIEEEQFVDRYNKLKEYLNQNAIVYGCFESDNLIGFVWFFEKNEMGLRLIHINQIVVDNAYRGQGIGTMLLNKTEEYCYLNKIDEIELIVTDSNKQAVEFYNNKDFYTERLIMKKKFDYDN